MPRSFDELGESLATVTFVVLDLETTGGSPVACAITEVGAVKLRGGECLGRFQTLVNPGVAIPPDVTYLTGITEAMVLPAPRISAVLAALLEFIGGAVIVGHNIRFDLGFMGAAMAREGYPKLGNLAVDTWALARRLIRDEVPDCRLATLAAHLNTVRRPTHRALDDAEATGEVLHGLLERAGCLGVLALEDLIDLPTVTGDSRLAKLKLTNRLPRQPGVYLLRDGCGRALYVGEAGNLRRRVRSYFGGGGDDDRKIGPLLRELAAVDHVVCRSELEARVLQVRLVHQLRPTYNRPAAYLRLTPRLGVVRQPRPGRGSRYLGPFPSAASARLVAEAIETAGGLNFEPLLGKVASLTAAGRLDEAAALRDRADALSSAIARQRRIDALRGAGRVTIAVPGEGGAVVDAGRLVATWPEGGARHRLEPPASGAMGPMLDEAAKIAAWLDARADRLPPGVLTGPGGGAMGPMLDDAVTIAAWLDGKGRSAPAPCANRPSL